MPSIDVAAAMHANRHRTGAPDALTPGDIGAAPASHTHSWDQVTGKPVNFPPASHTHPWSQVTGKPSTFAPSAHAASHASGGPDALSPADIGAVPDDDPRLLDTGIRDVTHLLTEDWEATSSGTLMLHMSRVGDIVYIQGRVRRVAGGGSRGAASTVFMPPVGFRPYGYVARGGAFVGSNIGSIAGFTSTREIASIAFEGEWGAGDTLSFDSIYRTTDSRPSEPLPGTPA